LTRDPDYTLTADGPLTDAAIETLAALLIASDEEAS
jgi:hypothetical protein